MGTGVIRLVSLPLRRSLMHANPRVLRGVCGIAILVLLWDVSARLSGLGSYFYPGPLDVVEAFRDLAWKGILPSYLVDSAGRYFLAVLSGTVLGIVFAIVIGSSLLLNRIFSPFINFMFSIVEVAWVPLFAIWWGYGLETIVVSVAYVVFFPILYNTLSGLKSVPEHYLRAAQTLGATPLQVLLSVRLPAALPHMIAGFRVGAGFAYRGLIFAEIVAAKSGIGYLIFEGVQTQQTAKTMVGMIVMGLSWLFIDAFFLKPLQQATVERWGTINVND